MNLAAILLGLGAGALFGFNVHIQRIGLDGTDGLTGAVVSVGSMASLFWLLSPFAVDYAWLLSWGTLIFAAAGLLFPAMGQFLQITSVARVGPAMTAAIGSFAPVFAVVPAIVFLGESFGLQGAIAVALMMTGLALSAIGPRGLPRGWPIWALLLPLGAAAARGLTQPALKYGMIDVPSPFMAAMITATVSTGVLLTLRALRRNVTPLPRVPRAFATFALSGVINGIGILSLAAAIRAGGVTLTAPLAATAPLWSLLFGGILFRRETIGLRHLGVAALVVLGVALLVTR